MLKKTITYTTFDGESKTKDFYFNLTKAELMKLELSRKGGFRAYLDALVKAENTSEMVQTFENIIKLSYGVRTEDEDGIHFRKTEKAAEDFISSEAYSELFMEFFADSDAAVAFIQGIVPTDVAAQAGANAVDLAKAKANVESLNK